MRSELLKGAYDIHVHTAPDVSPRAQDVLNTAQQAMAAGMDGIGIKDHTTSTAGRAAADGHGVLHRAQSRLCEIPLTTPHDHKRSERMGMNNLLRAIDETLLMGPGPSCVPPEVYEALSCPTIGHLDPHFIAIMDEIKVLLQRVMQTQNHLTIPMSGTGSAGMETCFVNLIEPGDPVLVLINGVFGQRMADVAGRLGANVKTLEFAWGTPVLPEQVKEELARRDYALVAVVHAETSTGVCNPVEQIGRLVQQTGALYLVDAVTSLGGIPVRMDDWGIDALYSGTQKCLSCPPGLSPVSFSLRAIDKLSARKIKVPNWYLDLSMIIKYWEGAKRAYHHTAPVNMLYGLHQALACILQEGLDHVFARHQEAHEQLVAGLDALGLGMLVEPSCRLPMLNAVRVPSGLDEANVRKRLLEEYRIEVGAGLGPLAGQIWRIGVMGHTARPQNVARLLAALHAILDTHRRKGPKVGSTQRV